MRKTLLTVVAGCALLAFAPASALAHGRGRHRHGHHSRGHHARAHHARAHRRTFGADQGQGTSQTTGTSPSAGTVQSFTGGVLTIALSNGTMVSGQMTNDTGIVCEAAQTGMQSTGWRGDQRDWNGGGGSDTSANNQSGGDDDQAQGDDDQGQGDDDNAGQFCSTSSLTPGAVVQEAVLSVSSNGEMWDKVVLAVPSSSSMPPSQPSGS